MPCSAVILDLPRVRTNYSVVNRWRFSVELLMNVWRRCCGGVWCTAPFVVTVANCHLWIVSITVSAADTCYVA